MKQQLLVHHELKVLSLYLVAIAVCVIAPKKGTQSVRSEPLYIWAVLFVACLFASVIASLWFIGPYYARHLVVALMFYFGALSLQKLNPNIDAASFAGLLGGTGFYLGRELVQAEMLLKVDWAGILAPLLGCVTVFIILDQIAKRRDDD